MKYPYLIECPFNGSVPTSVSLVERPCDNATNNLEILNKQPVDGVKKRFGVCSKKVRFESRDFLIRFIEWVHLLRILGADKMYFPFDYVHPEMFAVINNFEKRGILETWHYLSPTGIKDSKGRVEQRRLVETAVLTDCFYRTMNLYDFVVILDLDEVIMPLHPEDMTWDDLIRRANVSEYKDAYVSENVYYPETGAEPIGDIPRYMYMLQHIQRSQNCTTKDTAAKSFFGTERVLAVHNHKPYKCISKKNNNHDCKRYNFPSNVSQSSHYRTQLTPGKAFNATYDDKTLWKFKHRLVKDVQQTLLDLNLTP